MYLQKEGGLTRESRSFQVFDFLGAEPPHRALIGLVLEWPGKRFLPIYEINSAGLVASSQGLSTKKIIGTTSVLRLRAMGEDEPLPFMVRTARVSDQALYLQLDSLRIDQRLQIGQASKDLVIGRNLALAPRWLLSSRGVRGWFHAPFDTNILLFEDPKEGFLVEYEGVIWQFNSKGSTMRRSGSLVGEGEYPSLWFEKEKAVPAGVSRGWQNRLSAIVSESNVCQDLSIVQEQLERGQS